MAGKEPVLRCRVGSALWVLFISGCSTARMVHFRTSEPSEIWLGSERVCASTPCEYHYEPQGCAWPRLMATNRVVITATTGDGRSARVVEPDYCDLEGRVFLEIPPKER